MRLVIAALLLSLPVFGQVSDLANQTVASKPIVTTKNLSIISANGGAVLFYDSDGEVKQANDIFWDRVNRIFVLTGGFPLWQIGDSTAVNNLFHVGWSGNVLYFKDASTPFRTITFRGGPANHDLLTLDSNTGQVVISALALSGFPVFPFAVDGSLIYCTDCKPTSPCSSGGSGAMAVRNAGIWSCTAGSSSPAWYKYSLVKISNGVNGCANANGCWQINGVLGPNAAAGLTQDVPLFQLPASGFVETIRLKTATACTGTTTALSGLGTATNNVFYRAQTYDIQAAASATNFSDSISAAGSTTTVAVNVVASLITTIAGQNIDTLVAGCAVDYWLKWAVLP